MRIGYVLKRYPRFSETFIVNEILAHEAGGLDVEIFSLHPPNDTHFQDAISRVRAPIHYLTTEGPKAGDLWTALHQAAAVLPGLWAVVQAGADDEARDVYQAALVARSVPERRLTHLHAHFASAATTVARLAARMAGVPYTFTAHAKDIFHAAVQPDALRRKLSDAAAVVTVSDYNRAYLRDTFGPAASRVERIYNGLDLAQLAFALPVDRHPHVVAVGRLVEKKGFADLIDACAVLARRHRDLRCAIIGSGPLEEALHAQVRDLGLEAVVELLGPRPLREVLVYVQAAAVLAAPCVIGADGNRDGLPTVLLEAMALGTPCVATNLTGIPEAIRDGQTGLLVPQHDPAALAQAIERLLTYPALRVALATRARRLVEAEFDMYKNAARLRTVFAAAQADVIGEPVVR